MEALADLFNRTDPRIVFAILMVVLALVVYAMVRDLMGHNLAWSHPLTPFQYARRQARRGDAKACVKCADMLEKGTGGASHNPHAAQTFLTHALDIYNASARRGDGYAWLKMAEIYSRGLHPHDMPAIADRCYHKAFRLNLAAAKTGDTNGLAFTGYQLRFGLGCITDLGAAMDYLEAAAERNHAPSLKSLAELYMVGVRGKPDPVKAASLFRRAAALGDAEALERVGDNMLSATGERVSREEAYGWYAEAARKGRADAKRKLERIEDGWTPKQVREVQERLRSWSPAYASSDFIAGCVLRQASARALPSAISA